MKLFKTLFVCLLTALSAMTSAQKLVEYQEIAAENNPGIQARYTEFEAAMEKAAIVSSLPNPTLSFGYFISPVETRLGPQQAKFSLSQKFPWFGALAARENSEALMAKAKYQDFLEARNRLFAQVASAYYSLYEQKEQLRLQTENLQILKSYLRLARNKYENNQSSMVDVLRLDIMINDLQTEIDILRDKRKPLLSQFNNLLNREEATAVEVPDTIPILSLQKDYRRDSLLANQPLLESLKKKADAMEEKEKVAEKDGLPSFSLGIDYAMLGERTDMEVPDNGRDVIMPMLSVSIPIFRKKYKAAKKEAQLMQRSYRQQSEATANQLKSAYENTRFEMKRNRKNTELYQKQIKETQQVLNLLFSAYSNSGNDFEELLRMQQKLLKYEMLEVTALSNYHKSKAKLDYITAKTY